MIKGLDEYITEHQKELKPKFSELHDALDGNEPQRDQQGPMFAITACSGTTTKDPPYPVQPPITNEPETSNKVEADKEEEAPEQIPRIISPPSTPPTQPTRVPYPSRLKNKNRK